MFEIPHLSSALCLTPWSGCRGGQRLLGGLFAIATCIAGPAAAQVLPPMTSEVSIGVLNNKAQEFVYLPNGSVLSRLDWKTSHAVMLNTATSLHVLPWLALGLKGSTNLTGAARMDDYDFDLAGCPASTPGHTECHSSSPTRLRHALLLDVYASARIVQYGGVTLNVMAGYKSDNYKWQAFGGTANYLPPPGLPPGVGISYEQSWSAPYVGVSGALESGAWTLNGRLVGSAWAKGDDRDHHHLRSIVFTEDFGSSTYIGADVGVAYRMSAATSLTLGYSYQNWQTAKGSTTATAFGTTVIFPGDAAGGNNVSHMVSVGLKVNLNAPTVHGGSTKDGSVSRPPVWTGWYAGVASGPDWLRAHWQTKSLLSPGVAPVASTANAALSDQGARASGYAGYTWQTGGVVWGVEADLGRSNASATLTGIPGVTGSAFLPFFSDASMVTSGWDGSLRGRLGTLVMPSLLIYGTAGLAVQQVEARLSCPGASGAASWCVADRDEAVSKVKTGYTVGLGYEAQYSGNWFTRGEYRYTNTGSFDHAFFANAPIDTVSTKIDSSSHRLTFGLGYRF